MVADDQNPLPLAIAEDTATVELAQEDAVSGQRSSGQHDTRIKCRQLSADSYRGDGHRVLVLFVFVSPD